MLVHIFHRPFHTIPLLIDATLNFQSSQIQQLMKQALLTVLLTSSVPLTPAAI
ncbi:hypothetical protein D3C71_2225150 [compost metagenome]